MLLTLSTLLLLAAAAGMGLGSMVGHYRRIFRAIRDAQTVSPAGDLGWGEPGTLLVAAASVAWLAPFVLIAYAWLRLACDRPAVARPLRWWAVAQPVVTVLWLIAVYAADAMVHRAATLIDDPLTGPAQGVGAPTHWILLLGLLCPALGAFQRRRQPDLFEILGFPPRKSDGSKRVPPPLPPEEG
jgi:hypothetical protein